MGPKKGKEPRRIGNPPLSFREYRSQHDGCWVCYGKGNNHADDHRQCKVYEADKKAYFAAHPERKPKEQRISDWKAKGEDGRKGQGKGQGKGGGRGYGGGPGQDRGVRPIEEVAEDMLRNSKPSNVVDKVLADRSRKGLREVKSRGAPTGVGPRRSLLRKLVESQRKQRHIGCRRRLQRSQNH